MKAVTETHRRLLGSHLNESKSGWKCSRPVVSHLIKSCSVNITQPSSLSLWAFCVGQSAVLMKMD